MLVMRLYDSCNRHVGEKPNSTCSYGLMWTFMKPSEVTGDIVKYSDDT